MGEGDGMDFEMEYEMAQLLELTKQLSEQYTSKDSSSVTYETAGMLMEAVLYCIQEDRCLQNGKPRLPNRSKTGKDP